MVDIFQWTRMRSVVLLSANLSKAIKGLAVMEGKRYYGGNPMLVARAD